MGGGGGRGGAERVGQRGDAIVRCIYTVNCPWDPNGKKGDR